MKIGLAADHGGFQLKEYIAPILESNGYEIVDFGAHTLNSQDDYPDFVVPMAKAIVSKEIERGIAICGSGVGASIAANKVTGIRAALVHDHFSAHQGVEDDDMNLLCLGGRVVGNNVAQEIIETFLKARFTHAERHNRRLEKVHQLEIQKQ